MQLKTTPLKTAEHVKKLTKTILSQQLFQPRRWKASQYAFLTHITTWQKARGEEEERKGGGGREDLLLFPLGVYVCTLENCFQWNPKEIYIWTLVVLTTV